ncbi:Pectinesterase [Quillaja saponaria]|uniref:Pectinesterase n=1 Tax=Quillaja saponaria TaxID=32244 RepID=A0AAD7QF17_QUISA|nr:Pectinesterase [Quillaja saponaria]
MGKKIAVIGISSILLVAMVAAIAVGVSRGNGKDSSSAAPEVTQSQKNVQTLCQPTEFKETCEKSLASAANSTNDPKELIRAGFRYTVTELKTAIANTTTLRELNRDPRGRQALDACSELLNLAIDDLDNSFDKLGTFDPTQMDHYIMDLKVWIGATITYQQTCLDAFENVTGNAGDQMKKVLNLTSQLSANAYDMVNQVSTLIKGLQLNNINRRLLSDDGFPSWVTDGKRRLLQAAPGSIKADVVVAKDGSGQVNSVTEALKRVPKKNPKTFVIHVKAGIYNEHIIIGKDMPNVMLIGDGPTKTKITHNKNFADGTVTFHSATVAVVGANFIAKNIGIENSAGAIKHQAVALRSSGDNAIFFNCQFDGYQDTLYAHAKRQFYRDCTVSGTIDFIFGDGEAVFQNCKIVIRKPMDNQACIVTAQGRKKADGPGAIVLSGCHIMGDPLYIPVKNINKGYLGRPWKEYSRTIIMNTQIDDVIQPEGWLPWTGTFGLDTCFYAEVNNKGPGAVTANRVTWKGIKKITPQQAVDYTPGKYILGDSWIPQAGVPYASGM